MNEEEEVVLSFLENQGYNRDKILYEPRGNRTPDFLLNDEIAIEVRRLNQNKEGQGLEELSIKIHHALGKILTSFDKRYSGKTYYLNYEFKRALNFNKEIRNTIRNELNKFIENPSSPYYSNIYQNFSINIIEKGEPIEDNLFVLGSIIDKDRPGWTGQILLENLKFCIDEKTQKLKNTHNLSYKKWWLILVNKIHFLELSLNIEAHIVKPQIWDMIYIIDYRGQLLFEF